MHQADDPKPAVVMHLWRSAWQSLQRRLHHYSGRHAINSLTDAVVNDRSCKHGCSLILGVGGTVFGIVMMT